jgi:hypothetical protein
MGVNFRQGVSDGVYRDFVDGVRDVFIVQNNEYFVKKLRGKKYMVLLDEGVPGLPPMRFQIVSVVEGYGGAQEDVYGQYLTGSYLEIKLKKRGKTK